ncbi:synaptogyrin-1 isoform X2 [Camelus ferus]|uniref:Synaptogyrin-1 isoform X2 n=3 Tax=Camelus TaxID=9836 RepID=A0A8B8U0S1_CAMFR|nr:synaptogyrin-1 isoform X2 [Camelus ferus]
MEGGAYGAGKAGGAFDPYTLIRQPHTILRVVSWVFSIVVFGSIVNEGYLNSSSESEEFCIYNRNPNACGYGVTVGVLAFLTCLLYLALDVYFPQISSVKDRKKAVLSDIGVSAFWAFLWFVGFCYLANQWQVSKPKDNPLNEGTDAARAAIAFSFFSIFTWDTGLDSEARELREDQVCRSSSQGLIHSFPVCSCGLADGSRILKMWPLPQGGFPPPASPGSCI